MYIIYITHTHTHTHTYTHIHTHTHTYKIHNHQIAPELFLHPAGAAAQNHVTQMFMVRQHRSAARCFVPKFSQLSHFPLGHVITIIQRSGGGGGCGGGGGGGRGGEGGGRAGGGGSVSRCGCGGCWGVIVVEKVSENLILV